MALGRNPDFVQACVRRAAGARARPGCPRASGWRSLRGRRPAHRRSPQRALPIAPAGPIRSRLPRMGSRIHASRPPLGSMITSTSRPPRSNAVVAMRAPGYAGRRRDRCGRRAHSVTARCSPSAPTVRSCRLGIVSAVSRTTVCGPGATRRGGRVRPRSRPSTTIAAPSGCGGDGQWDRVPVVLAVVQTSRRASPVAPPTSQLRPAPQAPCR